MQYQRIKGNKKDTLKAKDLYDPVIRVSFYNTYYQNSLSSVLLFQSLPF